MVMKRVRAGAGRPTAAAWVLAVALGAAVCLMAGSALTITRADAYPVPLGVGMNSCDATSETFIDDKLGVDDAATAGQCLQSNGAPRYLLEPGAGVWTEPVYESGEPAPIEPAAPAVPEEPVYEEPAYNPPAPEEPVYSEPVPEPPAYEEPAYDEPAYEEPVYEEPVYEEPVYEEPAVCWYTGAASAYDPVCNGGTGTSSGIPLDWCTPTVASPWIPDGTYIEIVYNGMSVVAQVTDTGPFVGGRDLDLAPGVFYAFGFDSANSWGVRTVSYRIL